jgi:hypothetical protein
MVVMVLLELGQLVFPEKIFPLTFSMYKIIESRSDQVPDQVEGAVNITREFTVGLAVGIIGVGARVAVGRGAGMITFAVIGEVAVAAAVGRGAGMVTFAVIGEVAVAAVVGFDVDPSLVGYLVETGISGAGEMDE